MGEFVGSQMADEELAVEVETEEVETEETEKAEGETPETEQSADDEIVVTIGDESPTSEDEQEADGFKGPAPEWVKDLRKNSREKDKLLRERERELQELKAKIGQATENSPTVVGKEPTLEDPTGNPEDAYDAEVFKREWKAWNERKAKREAEQAKVRQAEEAQQREWQAKLDAYESEKSKIKVRDYEDAEGIVQETLNQTQQGIILHGSDNAALLVYALGKNPKKAKEIAAITDPVKFAFAVAKLEKELKVTNRKAPPPEKTVTGSGSISSAVTGSNLERLKEKARQTGDWSDYFAAKRKTESK